MKNQAKRGLRDVMRTALAAVFLAALLPVFLAAAPVPKLTIKSNAVIEITGGEGRSAWRLAYGTSPGAVAREEQWQFVVLLVPAGPNRAWFNHGRSLRLIDTEKGMVIGRWPFPAPITDMRVEGDKLRVHVQEGSGGPKSYRREILFDPAKPDIPFWPIDGLVALNVPYWEVSVGRVGATGTRVKPEEARRALPEFEEMARRDPLSPWFAVSVWRLRTDAGDPRANEVLQAALRPESSDYSELLRISTTLEVWGAPDEADRFFQAGYRDFLARGFDPRLLAAIMERYLIYSIWRTERLSPERRDAYLDNLYHLAPAQEGADLAWKGHARLLRQGQGLLTLHAGLWEKRAEYARANSLWEPARAARVLDHLLLVAAGAALAAVFYILVLYLRYRPQRKLDKITFARLLGPVRYRWNLYDWLGLAVVAGVPGGIIVWLALGAARAIGVAVLALLWVALVVAFVQALRLRARRQASKERGVPKPARAFLCIEYWSRKERLVLLAMVLVAWLGLGLMRFPAKPYDSAMRIPLVTFSGHLGSPVTVRYLEGRPAAPGRDLFLAVAYQHAGESDKAEALYRRLPQFAESWNNLGVLMAAQGKKQEAQQDFEQALRIDAQLQEASLNAGRGVHGEWAELHQKYLPGVPMLAPPRRQHLEDVLPRATWVDYLAVLTGPFQGFTALSKQYGNPWMDLLAFALQWALLPLLGLAALLPLLGLAIAALTILPARDVSQPPGELQPLWEVLFPGTTPRWSFAAVIVLLVWGYSVVSWMLLAALPTPYVASLIVLPNVPRAFGLSELGFDEIRPSGLVLFGIPALVFVVNLVVVLVRRPSSGSQVAAA